MLKVRKTPAQNNSAEWRLNNVQSTLFHSATKRAKLKKLPFDITKQDIVVPTHCPILGLELKPNQTGNKSHTKQSPSLDRIDNNKGYIKGNIQVISHLANAMKQNATRDELIKFADWINATYRLE